MQSRCAAEENAACSERALHKETLQKVEHLTGLNQKLTAAVAVVQLQAAVGVQDLLSQVISALLHAAHFVYRLFFQAGLSSLSSKSSQHQAEFLSNAKVRTTYSAFCCDVAAVLPFSLADPTAICSSRKCEVGSYIKC
jgi:hypothetical protein